MGITSREIVVDKAFKFKKRIDELRSKEYYSDEPKTLINLFDKVVVKISQSIEHIKKDDVILIKRINLLLSFYHLCLDEIEHIEANNVPVEMLPIFAEILKKFNVKTTLVFRPNPLYNYSYYPISRHMNEINKSQGYPELKTEDEIAVISFPSSEKTNSLMHCTFSHEVGHHLNEFLGIADEIEPKVLKLIDKNLMKKYAKKYLESLKKTSARIGNTEVTLDKFILEEHVIDRKTGEIGKILRNWLDEIISDTIALYLFGPAFLFSIAEFAISRQDFKKYTENHPPIFIRLKNLLNCLEEMELAESLDEYKHVLKRLKVYKKISKETFETTKMTMSNIENMILQRTIIASFDPAKEMIKKSLDLPSKVFNFSDVKHTIIALRNLIPGNEVLTEKSTSRPIDAISILNAAWIVRINFINELYSQLPKMAKKEVRNILNELTLKSLDLQAFHSKMVKKN